MNPVQFGRSVFMTYTSPDEDGHFKGFWDKKWLDGERFGVKWMFWNERQKMLDANTDVPGYRVRVLKSRQFPNARLFLDGPNLDVFTRVVHQRACRTVADRIRNASIDEMRMGFEGARFRETDVAMLEETPIAMAELVAGAEKMDLHPPNPSASCQRDDVPASQTLP